VTRRAGTFLVTFALFASFVGFATNVHAEQYHYSMTARVRPLLVFWISRSGVGGATVTRERTPEGTRYSLLIGSDPERAPRRINRWGYIEEEIRGAEARLIGLMTESDEDSIEQAEANLRAQAAGSHPFKVIQANVTASSASSRVTTIAAPEDYTFRQVGTVIELVRREPSAGPSRVIRLPAGTRPGFLVALSDAMHAAPNSAITYVYHGRLYELRQVRVQNIQSGTAAGDFVMTSLQDREQTRFSMTYGTAGSLAYVPLKVTYQPRWWMQVELTIDDASRTATNTDGAGR